MISLTLDDRTRVEPSVTSSGVRGQRDAVSHILPPTRGLIYATPERVFAFELDPAYFLDKSRFHPDDFTVVGSMETASDLAARISYEFIIMAGSQRSERVDQMKIIKSIPYGRVTRPTFYLHRKLCPSYYGVADGCGMV